jgi:hypothetical protein
MMADKKIISWEKWKNPYKVLSNKDLHKRANNGGVDLDEEDEDDEEEDHGHNGIVFITPLGMVPLGENNDPEKTFRFWNGNTNFNITKDIKNILNKAEGVEILNIHTRYRFRIGIGLLFDEEKVRVGINRKITDYFLDKEKKQQPQMEEVDDGEESEELYSGPDFDCTG